MERIPLNENNTVLLRAAGDVCVRGWDQADMQALCDHGRLVYTQQDNGVMYVVSKSDLCLSLPPGIPLRVEHVSGDAYIVGLSGKLDIQKVSGDLSVERCVQMNLAVTGGDLLLREITGTVTIQKVGGDLNGEALAGGLAVEQVGGSASFQAGTGPLHVRVGGDLKMFLPCEGNEEVTLKAGGDIEIYVDAQASARMELSSGGRDIDIDFNDRTTHSDEESTTTVLGAGARYVRARAGGDIRVTDEVWDAEDLVEDLEDVADQWAEWASGISEEESDNIAEVENRVRRRAEEATRRAEQRVREAMERVERQSRRRQDVFSRFGIRWGNFWQETPKPPPVNVPMPDIHIPPIEIPSIDVKIPPFPPVPPVPPAPDFHFSGVHFNPAAGTPPARPSSEPASAPETAGGASNEERMQVLKMLREHKITVEEAEELLRALNGDAD